jgi:hypothetical protein
MVFYCQIFSACPSIERKALQVQNTKPQKTLLNFFFFFAHSTNAPEAFRYSVIAAKDTRSPIKSIAGTSFLYIQENDLYFVAVSRHNVDAIAVFELLHKLVKLLKSYFGGYIDEEVLRKNFILVYELLDGSSIQTLHLNFFYFFFDAPQLFPTLLPEHCLTLISCLLLRNIGLWLCSDHRT